MTPRQTPHVPDAGEQAMLDAVGRGDESAFSQLFDRYYNAVFSHALSYAPTFEEAEEMTLDIFMQVWRKRDKLADVQDFKSWLFILGKNKMLDALRKKTVALISDESVQGLAGDLLLPDKQYQLKEIEAVVMNGVEQLTPQQRTIFRLSRQEGLSHEAIAQQLGLSINTVWWHMGAALNSLRTYTRQHFKDIDLALLSFALELILK